MKKISIITNCLKDEQHKVAEDIRYRIMQRLPDSVIPVFDICNDDWDIPEETEGIIVLGGDGSLLSAAKRIQPHEYPIIGVNLGNIGYLAEVELEGIDEALDALIEDRYITEDRMMVRGTVTRGNFTSSECLALNDVVLTRRGDLQVVGYRVYVNGMALTDFFADGIIISTPTGSTGYNMSAGGSIVDPMAEVIVLTPVSPHTLNSRSIILRPKDEIKVEILENRGHRPVDVGVYFDGYREMILNPKDYVTISGAKRITKIIKLKEQNFLEVLHHKIL